MRTDVTLNTLFVLTPGAYVRRDHKTVKVMVDGKVGVTVPIHHLEGIVIVGRTALSSGLLKLCAENGVYVSILDEKGRFVARVDNGTSGNVLLRRRQFRLADDTTFSCELAKRFVAGKIRNARNNLLRAAREVSDDDQIGILRQAAEELAYTLQALPSAGDLDTIRGYEGEAARAYFRAMSKWIRVSEPAMAFKGRFRRPPRDPVNAMLSFAYSILLHDVISALAAVGLDPFVGFLHADRPGKPSLALDLMEEMRPLICDRLVAALLNRKQFKMADFAVEPTGVVQMSDRARRKFLAAYIERKKQTVTHPLLGKEVMYGEIPLVQAKILARYLRGDVQDYVPCVLK